MRKTIILLVSTLLCGCETQIRLKSFQKTDAPISESHRVFFFSNMIDEKEHHDRILYEDFSKEFEKCNIKTDVFYYGQLRLDWKKELHTATEKFQPDKIITIRSDNLEMGAYNYIMSEDLYVNVYQIPGKKIWSGRYSVGVGSLLMGKKKGLQSRFDTPKITDTIFHDFHSAGLFLNCDARTEPKDATTQVAK